MIMNMIYFLISNLDITSFECIGFVIHGSAIFLDKIPIAPSTIPIYLLYYDFINIRGIPRYFTEYDGPSKDGLYIFISS